MASLSQAGTDWPLSQSYIFSKLFAIVFPHYWGTVTLHHLMCHSSSLHGVITLYDDRVLGYFSKHMVNNEKSMRHQRLQRVAAHQISCSYEKNGYEGIRMICDALRIAVWHNWLCWNAVVKFSLFIYATCTSLYKSVQAPKNQEIWWTMSFNPGFCVPGREHHYKHRA